MKKTFTSILATLLLGALTIGCTPEAQLEESQEDFQEQQVETSETINEAGEDGVLTESERENIREQRAETAEEAGDVLEAQGDVVEERAD